MRPILLGRERDALNSNSGGLEGPMERIALDIMGPLPATVESRSHLGLALDLDP